MNASDETYLVLKGTSQHGDDKNSWDYVWKCGVVSL
jgi:hypothetical protein